ncbi:MAG: AI-2E family transporter [Solirubrobacterales bacterium]
MLLPAPYGTGLEHRMDASQVSARAVAKVVLVAAGVIAILYFSYLIRTVIGLVLIAAFFAVAIAPAVNWLDRRKVPRWLAILLVYLGIAGGIFGIGLLIVPPLVTGVENLSTNLDDYAEDLRNNPTFRDYDEQYHITDKLKEQANQLPSKLADAAGTLRDVTVGVFSRLVQLFSILVITFFLVKDGNRLLEFFYRQLPDVRARRFRKIAGDISDAISGYVFGNFVISVLAGIVTYVTLTILGVPFALPLAILFGFFDLIPLVGATLGGIIVGIVVAFAAAFPIGLIVWVAVLILYQQVENNLVQPFVYGKAVQLHPLIVIIAILIGAALLGVLGALIAIPAAAAVQAVLRDYWRFRHPEDAPPPESGDASAEAPAEAG